MSNPMNNTVAVRLSTDLLKTAKHEASLAGISLSDAIRMSLTQWVRESKKTRQEIKLDEMKRASLLKDDPPKKSDAEILELIKKLTNS